MCRDDLIRIHYICFNLRVCTMADNEEEYFDVVDEHGIDTNVVHTRNHCHRHGLRTYTCQSQLSWSVHRSVHVLIFRNGKNGTYVL